MTNMTVEMQHFGLLFGLICVIASLVTGAIHLILTPKPRRPLS